MSSKLPGAYLEATIGGKELARSIAIPQPGKSTAHRTPSMLKRQNITDSDVSESFAPTQSYVQRPPRAKILFIV
jgi:hypothetical protein